MKKKNPVVVTEDVTKIVPVQELHKAFGNANYGTMKKRDVIKFAVLKCACGYHQGHTSNAIILELGLITPDYKLTDRGRIYLWAAFGASSHF